MKTKTRNISLILEFDIESDGLTSEELAKLRLSLSKELDRALDFYLENNTYDQEFSSLEEFGATLKNLTIN